ncbi:MAG: hypothetical protein V2I48_08200 [Xanthomonadales bacterium]|nr:hypothetical protein [Xanthomonadales bacterium]
MPDAPARRGKADYRYNVQNLARGSGDSQAHRGPAMALISKDEQLLFVRAPTTASSAVEKLLQASGKFRGLGEKHMNLKDLENLGLVDPETMQGLRKVRGVRNPFDLMVSAYFKNRSYGLKDRIGWIRQVPGLREEIKAARSMDFREWIHWLAGSRHLDMVYYRTALRYHDDRFDRIVRFECLIGDLGAALEGLACTAGLPRRNGLIELPEVGVNANRMRDYTPYYDGETRDMVARVASDDLRRFGYHFET